VANPIIKILIADSDGAACDQICSFLTGDPSYQVVGRAVNADECMGLALIKRPDVIIVHNSLKPISGIEVCEQLALQNLESATLLVVAQGMDESLFRRMMAAGVSELLVAPLQKNRAIDAIRNAFNKKAGQRHGDTPAPSEESRRIIAVTGPRGGCGRTVVAVNLSCAIAKAAERANPGSKNVVLADVNVRAGDAATFLDIRPQRTLSDVSAAASSVDREMIESLLENHPSGVTLLSASASEPYERQELSRGIIVSTLAVLRSKFKYTLVDVGVTGTEVSNVTLDFCDTILLVVGTDLPRLRAARLYLFHLLEANFPREKIQVVLNDIQPESKSISTSQAETILEAVVAARVPHEGRFIPDSINLGQPFVLTHPNCPASQAINGLAARFGAHVGKESAVKGLLKRLHWTSSSQALSSSVYAVPTRGAS
jgi:pilus assembly protein CpaE